MKRFGVVVRSACTEPFTVDLTQELVQALTYVHRVRRLLSERYRVDGDTAVAWLREGRDDEQRLVDLLARLDGAAQGTPERGM